MDLGLQLLRVIQQSLILLFDSVESGLELVLLEGEAFELCDFLFELSGHMLFGRWRLEDVCQLRLRLLAGPMPQFEGGPIGCDVLLNFGFLQRSPRRR